MAGLAEFDFIRSRLQPLATDPAALGLSDDAALFEGPNDTQWVIAKDAIVEGVHFRSQDPPETVAAKLLGTNLSDLAAMGADPTYYLTVIARPPATDPAWLDRFCEGLRTTQARYGLALLGGDTVSTRETKHFSCTIIGRVPNGQALLRSGAKSGDLLCVSGTLGDAALGLQVLNGLAVADDQHRFLAKRYQVPEPRIALGRALRGLATACIDISDGLAADVGHIADSSNLAAEIHSAALPLSAAGKAIPDAIPAALSGGDDYELAFTIPASQRDELDRLSRELTLPLTVIGRMMPGNGVTVLDKQGNRVELERQGWQHPA